MTTQLLTNARIATLAPDRPGLGLVDKGAILIRDGRIAHVGTSDDMPAAPEAEIHDLGDRWVTPALVDCHTHLVYGGDRAAEFEQRLAGASYEEIARAGGGIVSSVRATRSLDVDGLVAAALPRLDALLAEGVATIEIKSGYGLDIASECRILEAARALETVRPVRVKTSWLGAHAVPAEYAGRADAYLDEVAIAGLREAHRQGFVDAVDGFCEGIAFSSEQMKRLFDVARELGLPVKLHAEQLSHRGGAALAASYGALSADHLEYATAEDAAALAAAGSVAVLLPGAYYFVREPKAPPVALFREAGCRMALAMNMGATLFRMNVEECLAGVTREAARALGMLNETGTIEAGKRADLAVWDIERPAELVYRIGFNPLHARWFGGLRIGR